MAIEFSAQGKQQIERLLGRYPTKQAALLPLLHLSLEEFGNLSDPVIELVAKTLELPPSHVYGVTTFYTMFNQEPRGHNELMVCTNVACMLRGGNEILSHIEKKLGVKRGETTPDGCFTIIEEECLAACANAPMMICGPDYHLDLTPEKVDKIIEEMRKQFETKKKAGQIPARPPAVAQAPVTVPSTRASHH